MEDTRSSLKGNKYIFDDLTGLRITENSKYSFLVEKRNGGRIYVPKTLSNVFYSAGGKVELLVEDWFYNTNVKYL